MSWASAFFILWAFSAIGMWRPRWGFYCLFVWCAWMLGARPWDHFS